MVRHANMEVHTHTHTLTVTHRQTHRHTYTLTLLHTRTRPRLIQINENADGNGRNGDSHVVVESWNGVAEVSSTHVVGAWQRGTRRWNGLLDTLSLYRTSTEIFRAARAAILLCYSDVPEVIYTTSYYVRSRVTHVT